MSSPFFDPAAAAAELAWLQQHPAFDQRPATILEFLGENYLNVASLVRPGIKAALCDIFGDSVDGEIISKVRYAMVTGAIGIGKTTFASIALPYMVHWVLCLRDPQGFYDLMPGSRIAFMQMSTSEDQAKEVLFGDIDARIKHSKWFVNNYPRDPSFKNQIRFPKDIWILPGDSAETTFEGYNILGGILDEADSHKVTQTKDYAELGFDTINSRISSRFGDRGLLIVIGQMKKGSGFAARKYNELKSDPDAHVVRMSLWESYGWEKYLKPDGTRDSFWYDIKRKKIIPATVIGVVNNSNLIEIPTLYIKQFKNNPEKALRDLAGIPPATGDPFISLVDRIEECRDKWQERYENIGSPVTKDVVRPQFEKWFKAPDSLRRAVHIDLAYSANGDALGLAMGHVREMVEIEDELKPYIVFDMLYRVKAAPGTEIILGDIRRIVYELRDDRGFRIKDITMDGFQSTDSMQQFRKKKFRTDYVSVDKSVLPYHDLREAIYEHRVEFPPYFTYINNGDTTEVEIALKELTELTDTGKKIDHPEGGSKDVADAMAGVCFSLMGDRSYRRGVMSLPAPSDNNQSGEDPMSDRNSNIPSRLYTGTGSMRAPVPPTGTGGMLLPIPTRLQPSRRR